MRKTSSQWPENSDTWVTTYMARAPATEVRRITRMRFTSWFSSSERRRASRSTSAVPPRKASASIAPKERSVSGPTWRSSGNIGSVLLAAQADVHEQPDLDAGHDERRAPVGEERQRHAGDRRPAEGHQ